MHLLIDFFYLPLDTLFQTNSLLPFLGLFDKMGQQTFSQVSDQLCLHVCMPHISYCSFTLYPAWDIAMHECNHEAS